jgi:hypothetical protein
MTATDPVHTETETHTWSVNVPDHPQRADSPEYTAAKNKMNEIAAQAAGLLYGPGPFQDHHGSALWLQDSQGNPAAVTPVGARGSGVASVHVQYATPGSQLAEQKLQQESAGGALILPADHPLARQAFQNQ